MEKRLIDYKKKISIPHCLLKAYENDDKSTCQSYYEIVRGTKNIRLEVWCTEWIGGKKSGHREYKLAWLETLDKKYVNVDVANGMCGKCIRFSTSYYPIEDKLIETDITTSFPMFWKNWYHTYTKMWDTDTIKKFKDFKYITDVPYTTFGYETRQVLMTFLRKWIQYPITEMLMKMGFGYMVNDERFLSIKDKNKKTWIKYLSKHRDIIIAKKPDYNTLNKAIKTQTDLTLLLNLKYIKSNNQEQLLTDIENMVGKLDLEKLAKCIDGLSLNEYKDYILVCKTLNVRYEIYPNDLKAVHNKYTTMLSKKKNKIKSEKINEISTCIESQFTSRKKPISINGLEIRLTHSFNDFEILGRELKCCVARMHYSDDMILKHNLIILGIYKDDKPIECVELSVKSKKFSIAQCRGYDNMPSIYHNDCMSMLQNFCKRFTYNYVI